MQLLTTLLAGRSGLLIEAGSQWHAAKIDPIVALIHSVSQAQTTEMHTSVN